MSFAAAEADRRIANVVNLGVVVSVDAAKGRVTVRIGELLTPSIPVQQYRAGTLNFAMLPSVGEQVAVHAPSGDIARAFVGGSVPAGNLASPVASEPTIDLGGGQLVLMGDLIVVGGDVVADGISLKSHTHGGVVPGGAKTGGPV